MLTIPATIDPTPEVVKVTEFVNTVKYDGEKESDDSDYDKSSLHHE